jgi:hypothetical protein
MSSQAITPNSEAAILARIIQAIGFLLGIMQAKARRLVNVEPNLATL